MKMKLKDVLPMVRGSGYGYNDEGGKNIVLRPECEEWTWVKFNENSGLLDLLGDLTVQSIDAEDGDIALWLETENFNNFNSKHTEKMTIVQSGENNQSIENHGTITMNL